MKHKTGDKVIYIKKSKIEYAWELKEYDIFEVVNIALNIMGTVFYAVKDNKDQESSWYLEEDLISLKEYRNMKIKKVKNIN